MSTFFSQIKSVVNFSDHVDIPGTIENIKKGIDFKGPNVWILAFAIIVASVGLNVNSIPVIIGAMLISPLMGPIIGAGLSVGINDSELLKRSLKNLAIMVAISLIASSAFFAISPLTLEEPTELLARTKPTIYDVFIAFFGGLAGIVEGSRKEKGTVITGVAIATALMPPLCTAGFGIASLNFNFFIGAIYLFFINSFFISLATFVVVRYLKFPYVKLADPIKQKKVRRSVSIFAIIMIVPSIYTAVMVVRESRFSLNASAVVAENRNFSDKYIIGHTANVNSEPFKLEITYAGAPLTEAERETIFKSAERHKIKKENIVLKQSIFGKVESEKGETLKALFDRTEENIEQKNRKIDSLKTEINALKGTQIDNKQLEAEININYPGLEYATFASATDTTKEKGKGKIVIIVAKWKKPISTSQKEKLRQWAIVRLNADNVKIYQD